ncbi:alpha/beta-hydrolase [Sistotremastrum niveocremeum HHB9708]|uniref:Alpha/beta-hydrolase n=1 Tax=Sistotremastrum niveocremeum HHB9708 TaxID=1314777 RepID=A0A164VN88_9AGAM|nr:alpha/beta-hydrolase [Sistotremastrum niveocremeum HHB9708]
MEKSYTTLPLNNRAQPALRKTWLMRSMVVATFLFCLLWIYNRSGYLYNACSNRLMGYRVQSQSGPIAWYPCGNNIECGTLDVPFDYFNASAGNATLSLARYLAKDKKDRRGSLLANPGGPGGSGVSFIYRTAENISKIVDGKYDIVSWDPRGINQTTPRIECFASQTAQDIFSLNAQAPPIWNLTDPRRYDEHVTQVRITEASDAVVAQLCYERSGETLRHVGTATVVRDLERISSVLEGPEEPVNFWGFSYGTAVGSYFVNMFPDRVGRVVIDGNIDPVIWATVPSSDWYKYDLVDSEKDLQNFYAACSKAGPEGCSLAKLGSDPKTLSKAVDDMLDRLTQAPLPVPHAKRPGVLTASSVQGTHLVSHGSTLTNASTRKARMFVAMYQPRSWPTLASDLLAVINGDGAPIFNIVASELTLNNTVPAQTAYAITAVTCTDIPPYEDVDEEEVLEHLIEENVLANQVSPHFGGLSKDACHLWKATASERFTGPFNHTLSYPIIIIGNTADPITPLINAKATNTLLGDSSRLIIQDSNGHCSLSTASLCTAKALKAYFLEGTLPQDGLFCTPDETFFPTSEHKVDALHWLAPSGGEGDIQMMSVADIELLEAVRGLGISAGEFLNHGKPRGMVI